MVEAILWDNDGVLVDTEPLYFQATQRVLSSIGIGLTEKDYIQFFLVEGRGAWHLAAERGFAPHEVAALRNERNTLYARMLEAPLPPMNGIVSVLEQLHDRYVMGIATSSRRNHFDLSHRSTGLLQYFDFVLTAEDYPRVKPHPDPYLRAIKESGVRPDACIAIEDSERGLASALSAGLRCLVVPTPLTRGGRFAGADRVLGNVDEIPRALQQLSTRDPEAAEALPGSAGK
jgi:HAD superfamily hydrolase (TIGR01509 family)